MKAFCLFLFGLACLTVQITDAQVRAAHHHQYGYAGYPAVAYQAAPSQWAYAPQHASAYAVEYPSYSLGPVYATGRHISEEFLGKKDSGAVKGNVEQPKKDVVLPTYLPDFKLSSEANLNDDTTGTEIKVPEDSPLELFGVTVKDGLVKVHKILITKMSEGKITIKTPDGIFLTSPFSLAEGDEHSTLLTEEGKSARLLYIKQDGNVGNFFKTNGSRLGFVDVRALDLEGAKEDAAGFFKSVGQKIKNFFYNFFHHGEEGNRPVDKLPEVLKPEEDKKDGGDDAKPLIENVPTFPPLPGKEKFEELWSTDIAPKIDDKVLKKQQNRI